MPYTPLADHCLRRGRWFRWTPLRVRQRLLAGIVGDWPDGVLDPDRIAGVLKDRGSARLRQEHGSVWVVILGVLLSELIRLAIEWWLARSENRWQMRGWCRDAQANR